MRRSLSSIAICALAFGCKISKHKPEGEGEPQTKDTAMTTPSLPGTTLTPEQLADLRAYVIAGSTLLGRPELTPTDPAVVDRCVIESLVDGRYPAIGKERDDFVYNASSCLISWLSYKEDGLAYLSKRIEERYAHPVIARDGDLVRIDAGVVPGKVGLHKAMLQILRSPLIEQGELIASEVGRLLSLGMTQHPGARTYQVEVDIPATWKKPAWTYRFDRAEDTIRIYTDNWTDKFYVTGKLAGKPDSVTSLYHTSLTEQPLDQRPIRSTEVPKKPR